ncbi:MAG TPA: DinB family protein [Thermoanaerobaculia bacterium]|nr:DinB family protein [Thermoanaerobaculia bacterium]HQR67598.1 DinB family protein [Thermoanaerobaculia bacterium]
MTERPDPTEAAPYYFKYIDRVPPGDIVRTLEAQERDVLSLLAGIPDEKSLTRYAEGKWSLREVLRHLSDTERVFVFRAFWFARGFDSPLPDFDQETAAASGRADEVPWAHHLGEFRAVRESTLALFRDLPSGAWTLRGVASGSPFTVRALAYAAAGHVFHHVAILKARYL